MSLSRKEIDEIRKEVEEKMKELLNQKHDEMKAQAADVPPAYEIDVEMYPIHIDGGVTDYVVEEVNITLDTHWDRFEESGAPNDK